MNIFILEDDLFQRKRLEEVVRTISKKAGIEVKQLIATGKYAELLDSITERGSHQLYFLDIELKKSEKKGLEIAQLIRKRDELGTIVFVTTHSEFAQLTYAYKVSALDFISKEEADFEKRIGDCLQYVNVKRQKVDYEDPFVFESKYRKLKLPFSELLYFETSEQAHKIVLITKKQRIEFYANLSDIEKMDDRLYKCHKSFIVNLDNIIEIDKTNLIVHFANTETCLISRRKLKYISNWLDQKNK